MLTRTHLPLKPEKTPWLLVWRNISSPTVPLGETTGPGDDLSQYLKQHRSDKKFLTLPHCFYYLNVNCRSSFVLIISSTPPSQTEIITKFSSNDIEDVSHLPSRRFDWSALILNISIQSSLHWARLIQRKNFSQLFKPDSTVMDSPVSFPIPQTAVGTDAVSPNFKMIKHNLNLK